MNYKQGDVINFNWNDGSWLDKAIKFYNNSVYGNDGWSHSGIVGLVTQSDVLVYEAVNRGFEIGTYSKNYLNFLIKDGSAILGRPTFDTDNVLETCESYRGRPYGWYDLLNVVCIKLFGRKAINLAGPRDLICSEAVSRILYDTTDGKIDMPKEFQKEHDYITPTDLTKSKYLIWKNG